MAEPGAWDFGWTALGALAAAAAVVVALMVAFLLPIFRHLFLRPHVRVEFQNRPPFRRDGHSDPEGKWTDELWIRAHVTNRGRSAARGVTVKVAHVNGPENSSGAVGDAFDPLGLLWSGKKDGSPYLLSPGESKLVDLFKLQQWHNQEGHMEFITDEAEPKSQPNDYLAGQYVVEVVAFAENAHPSTHRFRVVVSDRIRDSTVRLD